MITPHVSDFGMQRRHQKRTSVIGHADSKN